MVEQVTRGGGEDDLHTQIPWGAGENPPDWAPHQVHAQKTWHDRAEEKETDLYPNTKWRREKNSGCV